jgi:hypothetical protein
MTSPSTSPDAARDAINEDLMELNVTSVEPDELPVATIDDEVLFSNEESDPEAPQPENREMQASNMVAAVKRISVCLIRM